jgi:nucleoside-diphosphate-sugar epimerase
LTWLGPLVAKGKTLVFGHGRNPINFVSALDVARFVDLAIADPSFRGKVVEVPGPENLALDQLVEIIETACGRSGSVSHTPRAVMRLLSIALRPIDRMRAGQIRAALVMDARDMTMDGRAVRAAYPSIPMTTAASVAERLFGAIAGRAVQPAAT